MDMKYEYDLSVVIPTLGRPTLRRAVESINESGLRIQVIIISAGQQYNSQVEKMLTGFYDYSLITSQAASSSAQRDMGVEAARGKYIAFLDDDDEWAANKCVKQILHIESSKNPHATLAGARVRFLRSSYSLLNSTSNKRVPGRSSLSSYLLARKSVLYRGNTFGSSSLLGPAELIRNIKWFDEGVGHDDWGYLLRMTESVANLAFVSPPEILAVIHQNSTNSVSKNTQVERSELFLRKHRAKIDKRAAADFWLLHIVVKKLGNRTFKARDFLINEYRVGVPHAACVMKFLASIALKTNNTH